jgi:hypothetical protein
LIVTIQEVNYLYNEFGKINGLFSQIAKRTIWRQNMKYLFADEENDELGEKKRGKYLKDEEDEKMEKV